MNYQPRAPRSIKMPFKVRRYTLIMIGIFLGIFIGLAFIPWQQTIYGTGRVIAYSPGDREQVISAPISGLIDKWYVNEGSVVKKGDKIVRLKDQDPLLLHRLIAEKKAIETGLEAYRQAARLAMINVERQKKLFETGIQSRRKYELAKFEHANYKVEIAKSEVSLINIRSRIARQKSQLVVAPQDGTITHRLSGSHSVLIKEGEVLAELVPKTNSRIVEMMISGNDMPLVHRDDLVVIQFEGWPAIQFSGWPSLAVNTFLGQVMVINPVANQGGFFRILVSPVDYHSWPGPSYLRQGVRTHNWVQLNQVPLWWELWRLFNGFPPQQRQASTKT